MTISRSLRYNRLEKSRREQRNLNIKSLDIEIEMKKLNNSIQECKNCNLCELEVNKLGIECNGKLIANHEHKTDFSKTILFIGLSPSYRRYDKELRAMKGVNENSTLEKFYTTGDLFRLCLKESGLLVKDIWITNLLKCSTNENSIPIEENYSQCIEWLKKEIELISPNIIVFLGKEVCEKLKYLEEDYKTFRVWHPSYLMRDKSKIKEYIENLKNIK